ncbi:hypothetical protein D3C80_1482730 [compost metagenome]
MAGIRCGDTGIRHLISLGIILWHCDGYLTAGWPQICFGRDGGCMKYTHHHASPYTGNYGQRYQPGDGTLAAHIGTLVI